MYSEKGRVSGLGREADGCQLRIAGAKAIGVDAFTGAAFLGVGADVHEIRVGPIDGRDFLVGCVGSASSEAEEEQERHEWPEKTLRWDHCFVQSHSIAVAQVYLVNTTGTGWS